MTLYLACCAGAGLVFYQYGHLLMPPTKEYNEVVQLLEKVEDRRRQEQQQAKT